MPAVTGRSLPTSVAGAAQFTVFRAIASPEIVPETTEFLVETGLICVIYLLDGRTGDFPIHCCRLVISLIVVCPDEGGEGHADRVREEMENAEREGSRPRREGRLWGAPQ